MVKQISAKQRRIIKAKIQGKSNKEIGQMEYPDATPDSQAVLVSRELKKPNVAQYYEQSKLLALKENNITWYRVIKPISDALEAVRANGAPDHQTRLSAAKQARELLEARPKDPDTPPITNKLPTNIDEVQLIRLLTSKEQN